MVHTRKAIDPGSIQTVSQWQGHNLAPTLTILPDIVTVRGRFQGPNITSWSQSVDSVTPLTNA